MGIKILVLSDGDTWDLAESCETLEITDAEMDQLQSGLSIEDLKFNREETERAKSGWEPRNFDGEPMGESPTDGELALEMGVTLRGEDDDTQDW